MNAEQLQKTLRASQYAEQVLGLHQAVLEKDYQIDENVDKLKTKKIKEYDKEKLREKIEKWQQILVTQRERVRHIEELEREEEED